MRQITLRIPDDVHDLVSAAAEGQQQSLNSFTVGALLAQVRTKSFSEWRQLVAEGEAISITQHDPGPNGTGSERTRRRDRRG